MVPTALSGAVKMGWRLMGTLTKTYLSGHFEAAVN